MVFDLKGIQNRSRVLSIVIVSLMVGAGLVGLLAAPASAADPPPGIEWTVYSSSYDHYEPNVWNNIVTWYAYTGSNYDVYWRTWSRREQAGGDTPPPVPRTGWSQRLTMIMSMSHLRRRMTWTRSLSYGPMKTSGHGTISSDRPLTSLCRRAG